MTQCKHIIGLDLGQLSDPSAAAIVRRSELLKGADRPASLPDWFPIRRFEVAALTPFPLGTSYVEIASRVRNRRATIPNGAVLALDATGVGRPIVDIFRDRHVSVEAITITGGQRWSHPSYGEWRVAKVELVAIVRMALETGMLVVGDFETADLLRRELINFRIKEHKSENEIYSTREGDHDDLVLAIATALWISWAMDVAPLFIASGEKIPRVNLPTIANPMNIIAKIAGLFAPKAIEGPPRITGDPQNHPAGASPPINLPGQNPYRR